MQNFCYRQKRQKTPRNSEIKRIVASTDGLAVATHTYQQLT